MGWARSNVSCWAGANGVKFFQGQLGFGLIRSEDAIIVYNKVVVAASSHHRSPGSITWKS